MRSRVIESSRALLAMVLLASAALGACIIGPKQDDPESSLTGGGPSDAGFDGAALDDDTGSSDKTDATVADTASPSAETGSPPDAGSDTSSTADTSVSDAASDAATDAPASDVADDAPEGG